VKIIGFLGSARVNGRCGKLLRRALEGAESKGAEVKRYDLIKCNIMYCRGCGKCFEQNPELTIGKCPLKDDMRSILEEYLQSDGYIFASPTHELFVTALMKTFLERKIALTCEEDPTEIPLARPGVRANFKKQASFIVTANAPEELEEVMGDPCYEAFEAGLMFEEVGTQEKLFVGGMRTITEEAFSKKINKAYQLGVNLVDAIENLRKEN
jgi:multimeric flavodoxin WrbA